MTDETRRLDSAIDHPALGTIGAYAAPSPDERNALIAAGARPVG